MKSLLIVALLAFMAQPFAAWAGDDICPLSVRLVGGVKDFERSAWANSGFLLEREYSRPSLSDAQVQLELGNIGSNMGLLLVRPGGKFSLYWRDQVSAMALDLPLYQNFSGLEIPLCADVLRLASTFAPRRHESLAATKFLNGESESKFSWGRFVLSLEEPLFYQVGTDSDSLNRLAEYDEKLKKIDERFSKVKNGDFLQRLDVLLQIRFEELGLSAYCKKGNTATSLFRDACAACQGETLVTLAVVKDLNLAIPDRYRLGVQLFTDHVRPVLWDTRLSRVLDLIYGGEWTSGINEPIYDPNILLDTFVHGRHSGLNPLEIAAQDSLPASCYMVAAAYGQKANASWDCSPLKRRWFGHGKSEPLNFVRFPSSPERGLFDDLNLQPTHRFYPNDPPERATIAYTQIGRRAGTVQPLPKPSLGLGLNTIGVTEWTLIKSIYDQRQLLNANERAMMDGFSDLMAHPEDFAIKLPDISFLGKSKMLKTLSFVPLGQKSSPTTYLLNGKMSVAWTNFQLALSLKEFTRGKLDRVVQAKGISEFLQPVLNWSELPTGSAANQVKASWPHMTIMERAQTFEQVWNLEWQSHLTSDDARDLKKFLNEKISDSSHFSNRLARFTPWLTQTSNDLKALWKLRGISGNFLQPSVALDSKNKALNAPAVDSNMRLLERLAARYALELGRSSRLVAGELSSWNESQLSEFFAFHQALAQVYLDLANESAGQDAKNLLKAVPALWPEWMARRYEFMSLLHYPLQPFFEGLLTDPEYQFSATPSASDAERLRKVIAGKKVVSFWKLKKEIQLSEWKPAAGFCNGKTPGLYSVSDNFAYECRETAKDVVTVRKTFALPPYFIFSLLAAQPREFLIEPHARVLIALMWNDGFEQAITKNLVHWLTLYLGNDPSTEIRNAIFGPSPILQRSEGFYARLKASQIAVVNNSSDTGAWLLPPSAFHSAKLFPQEIDSDPLYDLGLKFWLERAERTQASLTFYAPIGMSYGWALRSIDDGGAPVTEIIRSGEDILIYSKTSTLDLSEHQPVGMNTPFNVDLSSLSRVVSFH